MSIKQTTKSIISALFCGLICWSCQPNPDLQLAKDSNDLLVYCSEGSPDAFNPQLVSSGTSYDATAHTIYNQLVAYTPGTTNIAPGLAASWQISDDGTRYRFQLRKNVFFHGNDIFTPTRPLNADDVIFSFNRQRLSEHPFHTVSGGRYPYFYSQGLDQLILDIKKVDEYQVEFILSRPESPFLAILATPFASILSAEYADLLLAQGRPEWVDSKPIGTGPYRLKRYEPDSHIRYEAFDNYFAGPANIENLVYSITPDAAMRFARFSAGECDIMSNPLPVHLRIARQNKFSILEVPGLNVAYWAFNVEKPPFHDPKVRKALSMAINRDAILKAVYDRQAQLATSPIPPSSWAFNKQVTRVRHNSQQAKQLLAEAGYENGFSIDIWAMPIQRAYNPNARKMAEMMQQDLEKIGVKARIISYEWGTFLARVSQGLHHSVLLGWNADNGDPSNFLNPLLSCASARSGNNYARWCHPEFDQLILNASKSSDLEQRKEYYFKAQTLFKEESPWLTIAHANKSLLSQQNVKGLVISPVGNIEFDKVSLGSTPSTSSLSASEEEAH
ncbi:ABC transporter substrate-binding protein [Kangiella sp.]|uniref:ABC transporter substrate-binding protein n=1 Tax=Kangiella sp. TaxID=1920245 RepID=UPI003A8CB7E3